MYLYEIVCVCFFLAFNPFMKRKTVGKGERESAHGAALLD